MTSRAVIKSQPTGAKKNNKRTHFSRVYSGVRRKAAPPTHVDAYGSRQDKPEDKETSKEKEATPVKKTTKTKPTKRLGKAERVKVKRPKQAKRAKSREKNPKQSPGTNGEDGLLCAGGCGFYGIPENDGMCSVCARGDTSGRIQSQSRRQSSQKKALVCCNSEDYSLESVRCGSCGNYWHLSCAGLQSRMSKQFVCPRCAELEDPVNDQQKQSFEQGLLSDSDSDAYVELGSESEDTEELSDEEVQADDLLQPDSGNDQPSLSKTSPGKRLRARTLDDGDVTAYQARLARWRAALDGDEDHGGSVFTCPTCT